MTKARILVVDDDPSVLESLDLLLSHENYGVIKAKDGEEAIQLAHHHHPDLIILDVNLPKMSGYAVATFLDQEQQLADIPKILLTGTAQIAGNITITTSAKVKLSKPFDPDELIQIIQQLISETVDSDSPH